MGKCFDKRSEYNVSTNYKDNNIKSKGEANLNT